MLRLVLLTRLLALFSGGAASGADPSPDLLLSPGDPASLITPTTSEAELIERLGKAQVRRGEIDVGEGEKEPGTLLFPDDPERRVEVLWHDPETRQAPARVLIRSPESRWVIPPGIGIGTDLKTLEHLNGRPFELSGFSWDYAGTVGACEDGRLDPSRQRGVGILARMTPTRQDYEAGLSPADAEAVTGDRSVASDHPAMRQINPVVYEVGLVFDEGAAGDWADAAKAPPWPRPFAGDVYRCTVQMSRADWQSLTAERDTWFHGELLDLNGDGLCEVITQHDCGTGGCEGRILTPRNGALADIGDAPSLSRAVLLEPHAGWVQLESWYRSGFDYSERYLLRFEQDGYRQVRADHYGKGPGPDELSYAGTSFEPCCRLTAASGVRLRAAPDPAAAIVAVLPLGTVLTVLKTSDRPSRVGEVEGHWYQVRPRDVGTTIPGTEPVDGGEGRVFGPLTLPFDPEEPDSAYRTLLEAPGASTLARPWADDIDLMMFIARHLRRDDPSHPLMLEQGTGALERIDDLADRDRFCAQHQGGLLDARSIYAEVDGLATAWPVPPGEAPRTQPRDGPPAPPPVRLLQRIRLLVQACAAVHLRTLFEQEALGGMGLGSSEGDIERVTGCRFRRSAPEYQECCGFSIATWESGGCGMAFEIEYEDDGKTGNGTVYGIDLGEGFSGRTRLGIGIGSTREAFVAAYGSYWSEGDGSSSLEGKNGEYGPSFHFRFSDGRLVNIDIMPGHAN